MPAKQHHIPGLHLGKIRLCQKTPALLLLPLVQKLVGRVQNRRQYFQCLPITVQGSSLHITQAFLQQNLAQLPAGCQVPILGSLPVPLQRSLIVLHVYPPPNLSQYTNKKLIS